MRKSILFARSNFRKAKGQTVAVVALLFVASLMMNLWLMLSTDYRRNFERAHDRLNAEHVTLAVTGNDSALRKFLAETLERDERTVQYCMDDCLEMVGSFDWNGGGSPPCRIRLKEVSAWPDNVFSPLPPPPFSSHPQKGDGFRPCGRQN